LLRCGLEAQNSTTNSWQTPERWLGHHGASQAPVISCRLGQQEISQQQVNNFSTPSHHVRNSQKHSEALLQSSQNPPKTSAEAQIRHCIRAAAAWGPTFVGRRTAARCRAQVHPTCGTGRSGLRTFQNIRKILPSGKLLHNYGKSPCLIGQ